MKLNLRSLLTFFAAAALFAVSSCKKDTRVNPTPNSSPTEVDPKPVNTLAVAGFKVVGYLPSWAGDVNAVQYSKLTHINYAFIPPTPSGGIGAIDNVAKMQSLVSTGHANGVKVLASFGGWNDGDDSAFETLAANTTSRANFVTNLVNFTTQYNLDGIDIDWEYPDDGASANNYAALMSQLSTALHNKGKLLTAAVISDGGSGVLASVFGYVDYLNLMAYDGDGPNHSPYSLATTSLNYWIGRGLPKAKAILGVPFYGREPYTDYKDILAGGGSPNSDTWNNIGYNGIPTIKSKTTLAINQGGGIMIWELSQDATGANSLLSAIYSVISASGTGGGGTTTTAPIGHVISLKGFNGKYVSGENGTTAMTCTRATAGDWEHFTVVDAGSGHIYLRSMSKYVSSENGTQAITDNRTTASGWEAFTWGVNADGTITLRAVVNNDYVSSENGTQAMTCTRTTASGWESFTATIVQ